MNALSLFLACLLGISNAHNWMVSPSRVPFAATVFPCMPPRSNQPLVQVSQGQQFQMEWSTGHDRFVYFVLIKKNDSDFLSRDVERDLDRYITSAPSNMMNSYWAKKHRSTKTSGQTHTLGGTMASHYAGELLVGQSNYLARPPALGPEMHLYPYASSPNDAYVSYRSATYPWIVSLWRFEIQEADPNEWDVAVFDIPSAFITNGGDFIIHYVWSGYYDCIDINVLPQTTPIPYVYGKPVNGSDSLRANRIDHCVFDRPYQFTSWPRLILNGLKGAAAGCIEHCKYYFDKSGCAGVSVFPLSIITKNWGPHWSTTSNILQQLYADAWNPSGHFSDGLWNVDDGIPYDVLSGDIPRDLWRRFVRHPSFLEYTGVHQETFNTLKAFQENPFGVANPDPWVCVPVHPRTPTTTVDKMTLADDPLDAVWASTCYEIIEALEFIGFNLTENDFNPNVPFKQVGGGCLSCADAAAWRDEAYSPTWEIASKCQFCSRDVPNPGPNPRIPAAFAMKTLHTYANYQTGSCPVPSGYSSLDDYCQIEYLIYHPLMSSDNYPQTATDLGFIWPQENIFQGSPEVCYSWAKKQSECSDLMFFKYRTASWNKPYPEYSWWTPCGCIRRDPCCDTNMKPTTNSGANPEYGVGALYDMVQIPPDPTCSTGVKNTNQTYCCKGPCQTPYGCTDKASESWVSGNNAYCQAYNIPRDRWCSKWGPPCRLA
jgi:hypothetical protein